MRLIMNNLVKTVSMVVSAAAMWGCANTVDNQMISSVKNTQLLAELPMSFNSPASFTLDDNENVLFTSPNLHNDLFVKQGLMKAPAVPRIGMIDQNDNVNTWYVFQPQDMEPTSGTVVPMGLAKGPDGNIYVADMQLWAGGESRVLRLNVDKGQVVSVDVVAKGFSFPNALAWHNNMLYVSDTVLATQKGQSTTSGVYQISIDELKAAKPLQIKPFQSADNHDQHLFELFTSNGSLGFGANGLAFDDQGHMYTGLMEDGTVFKTAIDEQNRNSGSQLFAQGMIANDGIQWNANSRALYITDLFDNAVYRIDLNGELTLLAKNGDTTGENGELDGPGEVIVRGKRAYINNFDAAFGVPTMVNTTPDAPVTISVIELD